MKPTRINKDILPTNRAFTLFITVKTITDFNLVRNDKFKI